MAKLRKAREAVREQGARRVDFVELEDWASACGKPLDWFGTKRGR